jgi:hypothetical protein
MWRSGSGREIGRRFGRSSGSELDGAVAPDDPRRGRSHGSCGSGARRSPFSAPAFFGGDMGAGRSADCPRRPGSNRRLRGRGGGEDPGVVWRSASSSPACGRRGLAAGSQSGRCPAAARLDPPAWPSGGSPGTGGILPVVGHQGDLRSARRTVPHNALARSDPCRPGGIRNAAFIPGGSHGRARLGRPADPGSPGGSPRLAAHSGEGAGVSVAPGCSGDGPPRRLAGGHPELALRDARFGPSARPGDPGRRAEIQAGASEGAAAGDPGAAGRGGPGGSPLAAAGSIVRQRSSARKGKRTEPNEQNKEASCAT